jgi:hypothetical protein
MAKSNGEKFFFAGGNFFFLRASFLLFLILLMPPCEISHVFIFSKIFFHQVLEIFMRLCHFQPKTRDIFHILHTKYPSFSAKIFWTRKSKENLLRIPFHQSFNLHTLQPNTNIDSPLQVRSPRRGPSRAANQSLEVHCSSIIFPPNPKMVYLVLGGEDTNLFWVTKIIIPLS